MLVAMLFHLAFLLLLVVGAVWPVRALSRPPIGTAPPSVACPKCEEELRGPKSQAAYETSDEFTGEVEL